MADGGKLSAAGIDIVTRSEGIELWLAPYREVLDADFDGYRGHVYRVLSYAMHFLGPAHPRRREVEAALAFHDIGLWTAGTLDYLGPSIAEADKDLEGSDLDGALVRAAIRNHHKVTPYRGPHAEVVNAVRRADWVDASRGRLRKGLTRAQIAAVEAAIPNAGFHAALDRLTGELNGGDRLGGFLTLLRRVLKP